MTTSLHLFSLPNPSTLHPSRTSDLPGSRGIRIGSGRKQVSSACSEPPLQDTRQQRLLAVMGQRWQCHRRRVIPAPRRSAANPYLPRQLFHSRVEGTADTCQPRETCPLDLHVQLKGTICSECSVLHKEPPLGGKMHVYSLFCHTFPFQSKG